MNAPTLTPGAWLAVGAVGLGALYLMRNQAADLAAGAVGAAADVGAGAVLGVGDVLGVPRTNESQCAQDLAAGRTWEASFSCPAGTFISSTAGSIADTIGSAWDALWGSTGDSYLTDAQAIKARNDYAATDPRRVDLGGGASGSW